MPLPRDTTSLGFILLVLLTSLLVILSSLSFFPHTLSLPYTIMGDKSIHDVSSPLATNVATGPNVINGDANFELKPVLITMVQAILFCGKAHEDANAHLQHFCRFVAHSPLRE